jgi:SAM-dependent methyltransferase
VSALDFSASQLALARARQPSVRFELGSADALPFADASFDAVVSNFGMPHFPDPDAAIREAFRVLAPDGQFAFTVWDTPARAVGFGAVYAAIREHGSLDVGLPAGPNFFLFSDPAYCRQHLLEAGLLPVSVGVVPQVWRVPHPGAIFDAVVEGTVRAAATLCAQQPEALAAIREAVCTALAPYQQAEAYEVPMPAVLAVGRKVR